MTVSIKLYSNYIDNDPKPQMTGKTC